MNVNHYCYIENGTVKSGPRILPVNWVNVSNLNQLGDPDLLTLGWYLCVYPVISFDPVTQKKLSYTFDIQASTVIVNFQIGNKTQAEMEHDLAMLKLTKQLHNKRYCKSHIENLYPEPIQRSAAMGIYGFNSTTAMKDDIAAIIAEENRVFDLIEAATTAEEIDAVENPYWIEEFLP